MKLEPINKQMILLSLNGSNIEQIIFEESFNNKGLISVRYKKFRYYCREDQDFYCDNNNALVNNLSKTKEAKDTLLLNKISQIEDIIKSQEVSIEKKHDRIKQLKKQLT